MKNLSSRLKFFITSHTEYPSIRKFEAAIGWNNNTVNQMTDNPKVERLEDLESFFTNFNIEWLKTGEGAMLRPDKKTDALKQLEKIQNGKHKNNSGKLVSPDEVIKIKTFVIPIKGFAGLKNAIYDDQYITENFEETTTEVPKHLYSPISYKIQSSGDSMPYSIPPNAWVTGVPVPEMMWLDYKFLPDKIYVLFHPYRGILFKHVRNLPFNEIELYSQNPDKKEYPDEKFKITDFRKILLAIKVENFL